MEHSLKNDNAKVSTENDDNDTDFENTENTELEMAIEDSQEVIFEDSDEEDSDTPLVHGVNCECY